MGHLVKFDDFFKMANFFYTTIGIQPYDDESKPKNHHKTLTSTFIFYLGIVNMNYILFFELVYVVRAFSIGENILEAIMCLSYIGFVVVGDCKMFFVWQQKDTLSNFVKTLVEIFPRDSQLQMDYKLPRYLKQCTIVTVGFALLYMVLIWTYNLYAVVQYLLYEKWLQTRLVGQELPYYMYTWWNWHDHWSYYVLYILETFAGYTSATGQIASDLMLCAFCTQLVMHFDYLCQELSNYRVKLGPNLECREKAINQDMEFLRKLIKYHECLLVLCNQLNGIFSLPLLLNFSASSFVICFVGFQMTIGASPDTLIKLFLFLFSSAAQVYLICHYSQLLYDASINVADAVYNQNWSNADVRYQKMLVLMAERAQKPARLKATNFVLISRGTMTELMQLSYKFFALLRTMYVKK